MNKILMLMGFVLFLGILSVNDANASFFNSGSTWPGYGGYGMMNGYGMHNSGFGIGVNFYGGNGYYNGCAGYYGSYSYCPGNSYKDVYQNYQGYDLAKTQLGNNNFINYVSQSQRNTYDFASRGNPFTYGFASNSQDFYRPDNFGFRY